jgi:hypothetical protein
MASYNEIRSTDLSKLTTAADDWDAMAKDFGKLAESYKKQVHGIGISLGDAWIGVSATAGSARFDVTHKEYQGAQSEALAVAKVLRTAHAAFTGCGRRSNKYGRTPHGPACGCPSAVSSPSTPPSSSPVSTRPTSMTPATRRVPARQRPSGPHNSPWPCRW